MPRAYLGLGSNLGDREAALAEALEHLAEQVAIEEVSPVYESEPAGYLHQPYFLNLVVRIRTDLESTKLLDVVQGVERAMGRERTFRNAPRLIDIDILLYDDVKRAGPGLELPHPRMTDRDFVLRPLADLAPELELAGGTVATLLESATHGRATLYRPGPDLARWTGQGAS